jgi:hypothetical protein
MLRSRLAAIRSIGHDRGMGVMDEAFVIMQIGDAQLDVVCDEAIDPAIRDAGLTPRRVDRHNEGDLLKSEIVQFIERSQIIVADITNERPNCYLEIGYAMGLGKKANLVLTAREDHYHGSPNFRQDGPKVHFDLEGYSILFWSPADLPAFRTELAQLIRRRATIVRPSRGATDLPQRPEWRRELRDHAEVGLAAAGRDAYMEVAAELIPPGDWPQRRLLDALSDSEIHAFGWPIGVILENRPEYRPSPTSDGIKAEIAIGAGAGFPGEEGSYDFWKLFSDGRFYTLLSMSEDRRSTGMVWLDTRVVRVTEALLLLARLYRRLDASDTDSITVSVRHQGLKGRTLGAASHDRDVRPRTTTEDSLESSLTTSVSDLETNLVDHVREIIAPLLMLFEFFELSDPVLEEIVNRFAAEVR